MKFPQSQVKTINIIKKGIPIEADSRVPRVIGD